MMAAPLWSASEILAATKGTCDDTSWLANGVTIDSRSVQKEDLFIAIVGPNNDGHDYVEQALANGASAAIVDHIPEGLSAKYCRRLVLVPDTQAGMEDLARASRQRSRAKIVAITGSVGKTSTKETLAHILKQQGRTHCSVGSFNNHWGVPLSLSRMPVDAEYGIFELGMNHPGEIGPLSRMVRPHIAMITAIAAAHTEFFNSTDEIALAKAEICEGIEENGLLLLNADDTHCPILTKEAEKAGGFEIAYFGESPSATIHLEEVELLPTSSSITADVSGERHAFTLSVPGRHWVQNILGVLGIVKSLGGNLQQACHSLGTMVAPSGRGAVIEVPCDGGSFKVIDESYNASPVAMQAAFRVLGRHTIPHGGRKIAVLGDMRELGEKSPEIHAELANDILANGIDMVYACGPNMRYLFDVLPNTKQAGYGTSSNDLVAPLLHDISAGDIVLIKGSLGSKMKVVLDAVQAKSKDVSAVVDKGV
ncbi:UDP-N-acetylmuramoyl-tripeptide--D-alanyl-D-alanine ligase [Sneathiella sp.]|jgi:UDP-N-acetylmuramoyl-tripeptide--D-alanyl-D-alanine ligase|uniref:UDP-N-acetylmuramoyl-tripeptide--D-alanyl-D- alanine ligase n=1 Tax=Sneathiella sp. TaxID=1964365 RepID=UPI0039E608C3